MLVRPLGDSGLVASRVGLGLAALGRPGYITLGRARDLGEERSPDSLRQRSHAVLDAAWTAGIRYFDVARSYGRAEEFLGGWLRTRGHEPDRVTVASKWGYRYTAGWRVDAENHEVKEHSVEMLRLQWRESRSTLGDQLDLYQIHSATIESGVLRNRQVLDELAELRDRLGVKVGLTLSGPRQAETLRAAIRLEANGVRMFDTVQATWNLLEPSAGPALAEAHEAGMGVIVKEAMANGRLLARQEGDAARRLQSEADRLGTTPDVLAISAVLRQPWADVVLSGAVTTEQVRSNVRALEYRWDEASEEVLSALAEPPEEYWANRSRLAWR